MPDTALIVLAAGASTRMGSPKQLLSFQGKPLIRHAVETALASQCHPIVVVLGANAEEIRKVIEDLPITIAINPNWEQGMGTSIQTGLAALDESTAAAILTLADQPLLTAAFYNQLIEQHQKTNQPIITAEYAGTVGVPVLFHKSMFQPLNNLPPNQGCKGVILSHDHQALRLPCPEAEIDIDTPSDYLQACVRN